MSNEFLGDPRRSQSRRGPLSAARAYAARGWKLICLRGKLPATRHGYKDATDDDATLARWFSRRRGVNIGIVSGRASRLLVLDVDPRHGGDYALDALLAEHGPLPDTPTVVTGGGGRHYYFRLPPRAPARSRTIGAGLDLKGDGGYVVAPPSIHPNGREYFWDACSPAELGPLADAPAWLLSAASEPDDRAGGKDAARIIPSGRRNDALFRTAGALRRRGLDAEEILPALLEINRRRCRPPLSEREVRAIAAGTKRYEQGPPRRRRRVAHTVCLGEVRPENVRWLWKGRFPMGKVSLLVGDPGLGKSFITLDMAARVTTGAAWPDGAGAPPMGKVVILSAEDDLADTIRPRLDSAGGDAAKVFAIQGVALPRDEQGEPGGAPADADPFSPISLHGDLDVVSDKLAELGDVRLVVIDPLSAYLGNVDSHKNAEVRGLMARLAQIAQRHGCAIVCVSHMNKGGAKKAVYRPVGSLAFTAAARAVWLVVPATAEAARAKSQMPIEANKEASSKSQMPAAAAATRPPLTDSRLPFTAPAARQGQRRFVLRAKLNVEVATPGLAYCLRDGRVHWEREPVYLSADEGLALEAEAREAVGETHNAVEFLRQVLPPGTPVPSAEVTEEGAQQGIGSNALKRARRKLGITAYREGIQGGQGRGRWMLVRPGE